LDQSRGGGGVSWSNPRKYQERTSPGGGDNAKSNPKEVDNAKSNPKEADDAKSNPLLQPDFNGAESIFMPIHQNATLLKGQHPPSPAEMAEIVNLPCHKDISTPMHMPMGTSPKIPYAITMSIGFHPYTN